jgi:hypothetical protein
MQQGFQLREVFNPAVVDQLARNIARTWPTFDRIGFAATINSQLESLNFGARNTLIRDTLRAYLPKEFPQAVQILVDSLGPEIPHCELTGFDGFIIMPQNDFVAKYGLDYFDISIFPSNIRFAPLLRAPTIRAGMCWRYKSTERSMHGRRLISGKSQ